MRQSIPVGQNTIASNHLPDVQNRHFGLFCVPFASSSGPSLQVSVVAEIARENGFKTKVHYPNIQMAKRIGVNLYERLCEHRGIMLGEWLFSRAAFPNTVLKPSKEFFSNFETNIEDLGFRRDELEELRDTIIPEMVEEWADAVVLEDYFAFGFSSTFQQTNGCLALSRALKRRNTALPMIMGGANFDNPMGCEFLAKCEWIDYIVSGEAEDTLPKLLRHIVDPVRVGLAGTPGVYFRSINDTEAVATPPPSSIRELDDTPVPNFDDYFTAIAEYGFERPLALPIETSRGCWWGMKRHCTFCGLNTNGMAFRTKSDARIIREIDGLGRRYSINRFDAVDNILAPRLISSVFERIAREKIDAKFFYEVKANLKREQLCKLARGGVYRVQPGIESLNDRLLSLLNKGGSVLQNVRFLKWCAYYKIRVNWNLLCRIPGEREMDYVEQLEVLKLVSHLEPPSGDTAVWLERYSPYYTDANRYGIRNVRPEASYEFVYPTEFDLDNVAYFFEFDFENSISHDVMRPTIEYLEWWRKAWQPGNHTLVFERTFDSVIVKDSRDRVNKTEYRLDGALGMIYLSCVDTMLEVNQIEKSCGEAVDAASSEIRAVLDQFVTAGLMITDGKYYLSLAIPENSNW